MIVMALGDGALRFGEIRDAVDGISGKVLASTLKDLERDGIVLRRAFAEVPPRVEYELTELGRTLFDPLTALVAWAESHMSAVLESRSAYDALHGPPDER